MKVKEFLRLIDTATENTEIKVENGEVVISEPKREGITDRIKTFEDAVEWCKENKPSLYLNWKDYFDLGEGDEDILAYLKLRIITAALNEGWEPKLEKNERRYYLYTYINDGSIGVGFESNAICYPPKLSFKSGDLAEYAAEQFRDVYADFCGVKRGGEE